VTAAVVFTFGTPYFQGMSHLSTLDYLVPVNATQSGAAYNPSADPVAFVFAATATYVPQSGDWISGGWDANPSSALYPYNAKVLVGAGASGAAILGISTCIVYMRVTDNPEIPVVIVGQFQVS
jgi:hypothetical protein